MNGSVKKKKKEKGEDLKLKSKKVLKYYISIFRVADSGFCCTVYVDHIHVGNAKICDSLLKEADHKSHDRYFFVFFFYQ